MLTHFRTGQGRCAANLHKWHMTSSDKCQCGGVQTMSHIVQSCPLTIDVTASASLNWWLQNVAVKAFAKWMN